MQALPGVGQGRCTPPTQPSANLGGVPHKVSQGIARYPTASQGIARYPTNATNLPRMPPAGCVGRQYRRGSIGAAVSARQQYLWCTSCAPSGTLPRGWCKRQRRVQKKHVMPRAATYRPQKVDIKRRETPSAPITTWHGTARQARSLLQVVLPVPGTVPGRTRVSFLESRSS